MWVKFEPDGDNPLLKVTWSDGSGMFVGPYFIGPATLMEKADAVRAELRNLSEWAVDGAPESRWKRLTALAKAGKELHGALFLDQENWQVVKELKEVIADEYEADRSLRIYIDSNVHIPWGLVFDGKVPTFPADVDPQQLKAVEMSLFSNFWALKYDLSVGSKKHSSKKNIRRPENFGLLSLVNGAVFESIERQTDNPSCRKLCELMSARVGTAKSLDECQELIEDTPATDILFHFFGHQHDQRLDLGAGGEVSFIEFCALMTSLAEHGVERNATPYGLMFLNGCESAMGKADYSFRAKAMSNEMCGVIATESIVRTSFAAEFGRRFLEAMAYQERTVSAAMHDLWHAEDLWPESLLYGCYANPDYRITSQALTGAR